MLYYAVFHCIVYSTVHRLSLLFHLRALLFSLIAKVNMSQDSMEFDETQLQGEEQFEHTDLDPSNHTSFPQNRNSLSFASNSFSKSYSIHHDHDFYGDPSSAGESSAFISHPEAHSSDLDLSNATDLDSSLTSMRESLAQLRVTSPQNKPDVSPWRRLRSSQPPLPAPKFSLSQGAPKLGPPSLTSSDSHSKNVPYSSETSGNTAAQISHLSNQVTDYRIQIRLLRRFIQRMVQRFRDEGNNLDLAEELFVQELKDSPSLNGHDERFDEILKLNEDLYASLEAFEAQIKDKDNELGRYKAANKEYQHALDSLIRELGQEPPDNTAERLQMLRKAYHEHHLASMAKIEQLLDHQNTEIAALNARVESELAAARAASEDFRQIIDKMNSMRDSNTEIVDPTDKNAKDILTRQLDSHYDTEKRLQREIDTLRSQNTDQAKQIKLEQELETALQDAALTKEESERKIASLNSQIANLRELVSKLRDEQAQHELHERELDAAVEKERVLRAEKVRLSHQVQALLEEKESATSAIDRLSKKLAAYKSRGTLPDASKELLLFLFDLDQFLKMLTSFEKIADDSSLKEPKHHLAALQKTLRLGQFTLTDSMSSHLYVFKYLARAVDVLVNDHVKLLLKEAEVNQQSNEYVSKLQKRIDDLSRANDSLSRQLDDLEDGKSVESDPQASPRARLRIDELLSRWKAEREARVYENREASRRVRELETENAKLRAQLSKT